MSHINTRSVVLVTGVSGFIGKFLARHLIDNGFEIVGVCRSKARVPEDLLRMCKRIHEIDINEETDWSQLLHGVDFIVHTAAHVHVRHPRKRDLNRFNWVNVEGLRKLAESARDSAVRLFINLSSIAAGFDQKHVRTNAYGVSKKIGEDVLVAVLGETRCRYLNLRLPAVYGPGMKGGLHWLTAVVKTRLPLPIVDESPERSYLSAWNLADCVSHCLVNNLGMNRTLAIADHEALNIQSLVDLIAAAHDQRARTIKLPVRLFALISSIFGRRREFERGMTPTLIDATNAERILGWTVPISAEESWRRVARLT